MAWVEVRCAGGCGRRLAADKDSIDEGALAYCMVCKPEELPLRVEYDGIGTS